MHIVDSLNKEEEFSLMTPVNKVIVGIKGSPSTPSEAINLLLVHDDIIYYKHLEATLKRRGVSIVHFPALYDEATAV